MRCAVRIAMPTPCFIYFASLWGLKVIPVGMMCPPIVAARTAVHPESQPLALPAFLPRYSGVSRSDSLLIVCEKSH